ncbi:uncharacterized protein LOC105846755 [Hydra vulgaris]|uniref:uncharacterized protein LOC105846755 n=1 Tax=Hydra vulgaris TaxID=6087 RepID=UPI001F5F196A|nr:uncharacterized protein LOC105846755 [Hydra vulgaris]XP_047123304.1 uncharacterized protein LOC105846755 [Hydra vulgaris]XP_047123305.1 uncharacterized protein LOC105846755 [Hydra vulgaris]XP_047123306.1 uncharacterized protein LOC105846755 [Hydra vulgaris]
MNSTNSQTNSLFLQQKKSFPHNFQQPCSINSASIARKKPCSLNTSLSLKRPNSYRAQKKKVEEEEKKKSSSSLLNRLRSISSPNIHNGFNETTSSDQDVDNGLVQTKSHEELNNSSSTSDRNLRNNKNDKNESINHNSIQKINIFTDTSRKKSVAAVLGDIKDFKIRRSNSAKTPNKHNRETRKVKRLTLNEENMKDFDVPMFPATTLFVPGYDFETRQKKNDIQKSFRKQSSPILSRRGSRDNTAMKLTSPTTNHKSSSLIQEDKDTSAAANASKPELKKFSPLLARRGSLPRYFPILLKRNSKEKICVSVNQTNQVTNNNDRLPVSSEELEECVSGLDLNDRKKILLKNQEKFAQKKKNSKAEDDVPYEHVYGKVKNISSAFDKGTPFKEDSRNSFFRTKSLPTKYDGKTCVEKLAYTCKNLSNYNKNGVEYLGDFEPNGGRSKVEGYTNGDFHFSKPEFNIITPSPTPKSYLNDDALSNSWPNIRETTTDLCVTEL